MERGVLQGYLAYQGNEVVGWCNANQKSECQNCDGWLRFMQPVGNDQPSLKIKSVFCFVIAPEMQRKGIATMLLERVCEDAKAEGFDMVEAYPNKSFLSVAYDFRGPNSMYQKLGFTVKKELSDIYVVQKSFR